MEETGVSTKGRLDYEQESEVVSRRLIEIANDPTGWNLEKAASDNHGVKIESRKSHVGECDIIMSTTEVDAPARRVLAMCLPWLPYRGRWDELVDSTQIIDQLSPSVYVMQTLTKKRIPLSARESIDVITVGKEENFIYVSSVGTTHPDFPVCTKYVRTHQHLGGYVIYPEENENQCTFKMLFHADLNIAGPKLMSSIVDMVKPKVMTEKIRQLKKALLTMQVDEAHMKGLPV